MQLRKERREGGGDRTNFKSLVFITRMNTRFDSIFMFKLNKLQGTRAETICGLCPQLRFVGVS